MYFNFNYMIKNPNGTRNIDYRRSRRKQIRVEIRMYILFRLVPVRPGIWHAGVAYLHACT